MENMMSNAKHICTKINSGKYAIKIDDRISYESFEKLGKYLNKLGYNIEEYPWASDTNFIVLCEDSNNLTTVKDWDGLTLDDFDIFKVMGDKPRNQVCVDV